MEVPISQAGGVQLGGGVHIGHGSVALWLIGGRQFGQDEQRRPGRGRRRLGRVLIESGGIQRGRQGRCLGRGLRARAQAGGIPLGGETRRPGSRREGQSAAGGDVLAGAPSSATVSSAASYGVQLNVRLDAPASSP